MAQPGKLLNQMLIIGVHRLANNNRLGNKSPVLLCCVDQYAKHPQSNSMEYSVAGCLHDGGGGRVGFDVVPHQHRPADTRQ